MKNKILVFETTKDFSYDSKKRDEIMSAIRKSLHFNKEDTLFFIDGSNRNYVYFVSDNWFTKALNAFRLKRLLKKLHETTNAK